MSFLFFSSGRELFLANASLFVDDAEAYEKYQREEEPEADEPKVILCVNFIQIACFFRVICDSIHELCHVNSDFMTTFFPDEFFSRTFKFLGITFYAPTPLF